MLEPTPRPSFPRSPRSHAAAGIALAALLLAGCVPNVFPQFRGATLQSVQADVDAAALRLELGLRWRFPNPLEQQLTVPAHAFRLLVTNLDGQEVELPGSASSVPEFTIPAGGATDVSYPVVIELGPGSDAAELDLLGRDVPYAFEADIVIDPPGVLVPDQTLTLRFDDRLRLPLLPTLRLRQGATPSATLLGDIGYYDVADAVEPIYDGMDPFVRALFSAGDLLIPALTPVVGLTGIDLGDAWDDFQGGWNALGELDARVPDLSQSQIDGVALTLPLELVNPNRFPVAAPSLRTALTVTGAPPVLGFEASWPQGELVPAQATVPFVVSGELRWASAGLGLLELFAGQSVTVDLSGEAEVDLGYGLVRVPVTLTAVELDLGSD